MKAGRIKFIGSFVVILAAMTGTMIAFQNCAPLVEFNSASSPSSSGVQSASYGTFTQTYVGTETYISGSNTLSNPITVTLTINGSALTGNYNDGNGTVGTISGQVKDDEITSFTATNASNSVCGPGTFAGTGVISGTEIDFSIQGGSKNCGAIDGNISALHFLSATQLSYPASTALPDTIWVSSCVHASAGNSYLRTAFSFFNGSDLGTAYYDIGVYSTAGCAAGTEVGRYSLYLIENPGSVSATVVGAANLSFETVICTKKEAGNAEQETFWSSACINGLGIPAKLLAPIKATIFSVQGSNLYFGTTSLDTTTAFVLTAPNPI